MLHVRDGRFPGEILLYPACVVGWLRSPNQAKDPEVNMRVASREHSEAFEGWLLRRLHEAVESGEMPAELVEKFRADATGQEADLSSVRHPIAIRLIADLARVPREQASVLLASLESKNPTNTEGVLQRIAEAWLRQHNAEVRGQG